MSAPIRQSPPSSLDGELSLAQADYHALRSRNLSLDLTDRKSVG